MKKIIIIFVAFVFCTITTSAQSSFLKKVNYGVEVGTNISSVNFSGRIVDWELINPQPEMKFGYQFGVFANYHINDLFMVETGLSFMSKGYSLPKRTKSIGGFSIIKYSQTGSSYYLEMPFLFGVSYPIKELVIHLKVGPYIAYGVSGNVEIEKPSATINSDMFSDENIYPFKRFDYGGKLVLGIDFWKVSFDVYYDFGLANLANFDDSKLSSTAVGGGTFENDKVHSYSIGLTARYKF